MGHFHQPKERFINRNKKLWQRTAIVSLLAMFMQVNITTDVAAVEKEKILVKKIIHKETPIVTGKQIGRAHV